MLVAIQIFIKNRRSFIARSPDVSEMRHESAILDSLQACILDADCGPGVETTVALCNTRQEEICFTYGCEAAKNGGQDCSPGLCALSKKTSAAV